MAIPILRRRFPAVPTQHSQEQVLIERPAPAAAPDALVLPIGTSAAVGGLAGGDLRVEAMEGFGVLRACALAGVPAVEIRAISNELAENDRSRWRIGRALEALSVVLPDVLEAAAK